MGRNVHIRHSKRIRKSPQWCDPGFGSDRDWKSDAVASIVYMIQDGDFNRTLDMDKILSLMDEWYKKHCMDAPSIIHMKESYAIKSRSHDPDTSTYMKALSGEHGDECYKAMDYEIHSLMIEDTWYLVSRKSIAYHNVLTGTCYFKFKRKPDWTISKFKARYYVIGHVQKRLSPEPLNSYLPVLQWDNDFDVDFAVYSRVEKSKYMPLLRQIFQVGSQNSQEFQ